MHLIYADDVVLPGIGTTAMALLITEVVEIGPGASNKVVSTAEFSGIETE